MEFRVVSLNVNSIVEHRRKFLLNDFISRNPAHIYFFQETKFGPSHRFSHSGFASFFASNRFGSGGVAIMVHDGLRVRNVKRIVGHIDGIVLEVYLGQSWTTFGSIYIHPGCPNMAWIEGLLSASEQFLVGGDLNARHSSFGDVSNNSVGIWLDHFRTGSGVNVLSPTVPTCFHSAHGSFIDKFIAAPRLNCSYSAVAALPSFSDHSGIGITLHCPAFDLQIRNGFELRQFNFVSPVKLNRHLERELAALVIPTDRDLLDGDLEHLATRIESIFSAAVEKLVPVTFVHTNGILLSFRSIALLRRCHSLQRKLHRNLGRGTILPSIAAIRRDCAMVRRMTLDSIGGDLNDHYRNAMANTDSMRRAHGNVSTLTGYRRRAGRPDVLFVNESKSDSLSGAEAIANGFLERFSANHNISTGMASSMDPIVGESVRAVDNAELTIPFGGGISPLILDRIDLDIIEGRLSPARRGVLMCSEELSGVISRAPAGRSSGPDGMPYVLIKQFSTHVIIHLTIFFNHLFSRSYFPQIWKHSLVTPIPKPHRDTSIISNWRPISNLNCVSKLFERVVAHRLLRHTNGLNIFGTQFGFLAGHSTYHALAHLQGAVDRGLNDGKLTAFVSLDLRAAFDTVWHDGLVYKMDQLGFPLPLIKVIRSFLSNRTFSVRIDKHLSASAPMPSGTPQGSVCSPILFNIYLSDIPTHRHVQTIQYADDTSLFCTGDSAGVVQGAMNLHLVSLAQYFAAWKLSLNPAKTELLVFLGFARENNVRMRRDFRAIAISVGGHLLRPKNVIRFLGVHLNRNNRAVQHVDHALAAARRSFFALRSMLRSSLIDPRIKTNMYKCYIRPILTYASPIWARPELLSSHQMERLRTFERMVLRHAANVYRGVGSFRYINNTRLYERADCPRIDRHIAELALRFFERCHLASGDKLNSFLGLGDGRIFPAIDTLRARDASGTLYEHGMLNIFHRHYGHNGGLVYNTNQ